MQLDPRDFAPTNAQAAAHLDKLARLAEDRAEYCLARSLRFLRDDFQGEYDREQTA